MRLTILVFGLAVLVTAALARCLTAGVLYFGQMDVSERLEDNAPTPK